MSGESYCPECGAVFTGLPHQCTPKILLTDEEIKQVVATVPIDEFTTSYEYGQQLLAEYQEKVNQAIAKAQLKKVVEWLNGENDKPKDVGVGLILTLDGWQALLEEVK